MYLAPCENVLYVWASCRLTKAASLILCGSNDVNWGQSRQVAQADTKRHERNAQETIAGQDNYTWRRSPAEDEIWSVVSLKYPVLRTTVWAQNDMCDWELLELIEETYTDVHRQWTPGDMCPRKRAHTADQGNCGGPVKLEDELWL